MQPSHTGLSALPSEVLNCIATHFTGNADLISFASVNKALRFACLPSLYRTIKIKSVIDVLKMYFIGLSPFARYVQQIDFCTSSESYIDKHTQSQAIKEVGRVSLVMIYLDPRVSLWFPEEWASIRTLAFQTLAISKDNEYTQPQTSAPFYSIANVPFSANTQHLVRLSESVDYCWQQYFAQASELGIKLLARNGATVKKIKLSLSGDYDGQTWVPDQILPLLADKFHLTTISFDDLNINTPILFNYQSLAHLTLSYNCWESGKIKEGLIAILSSTHCQLESLSLRLPWHSLEDDIDDESEDSTKVVYLLGPTSTWPKLRSLKLYSQETDSTSVEMTYVAYIGIYISETMECPALTSLEVNGEDYHTKIVFGPYFRQLACHVDNKIPNVMLPWLQTTTSLRRFTFTVDRAVTIEDLGSFFSSIPQATEVNLKLEVMSEDPPLDDEFALTDLAEAAVASNCLPLHRNLKRLFITVGECEQVMNWDRPIKSLYNLFPAICQFGNDVVHNN